MDNYRKREELLMVFEFLRCPLLKKACLLLSIFRFVSDKHVV